MRNDDSNAGQQPSGGNSSLGTHRGLQTRLPDEASRAEILRARLAEVPEPLLTVDIAQIAQSSRGLTGADLKAAVEDAKLLFAHDIATGVPARKIENYFLDAIEAIRKNRRGYTKTRRPDFRESAPIGFQGCTRDTTRG